MDAVDTAVSQGNLENDFAAQTGDRFVGVEPARLPPVNSGRTFPVYRNYSFCPNETPSKSRRQITEPEHCKIVALFPSDIEFA